MNMNKQTILDLTEQFEADSNPVLTTECLSVQRLSTEDRLPLYNLTLPTIKRGNDS